jgi:flagellar P-ring protein FlgI
MILGARPVLARLRRAARFRCLRTPSASSTACAVGLPPRSSAVLAPLSRRSVDWVGRAGDVRALFSIVVGLLLVPSVVRGARLKDIASIEGVRSNQLSGYGIVAGLNGSGDSQQAIFTVQSVLNMLKRRGITLNVNPRQLQVKNVAAVAVTAVLPPFAHQGSRIDAEASSLGDAKSLQGGTLLLSPLFGGDGQVYAVAQGPVSLGGGFSARAAGATAQKSHPTTAVVTNGALVEREVPVQLGAGGVLTVALHRPDFTTAERVTEAVNRTLGRSVAHLVDAGTVTVALSEESAAEAVGTATAIERVEVTPDAVAHVVLNERTGTVIIGSDVRVAPVAIAHGSLQVTVKTDFGVSQPAPFSNGETVVVPDSTVNVQEGAKQNLVLLRPGVNLGQLVAGLNALGVTPQDLIAILQAVQTSGALQAELELM